MAKIDDATLDMLPKQYVGANGTWMGVTARTRIVVFNPKKIDEKDLPKSVMDFANPEWDGRVGYVPTSGPSKKPWPSSSCMAAKRPRNG